MSKISIQHTKNPSVIKYEFDQMLTENSFEYNSIDDAGNSTLVQQMFHLPFVKKVYITANFIAVEKFDILQWDEVENELKDILEAYINEHNTVFNISQKESLVEVYAESTPNPQVQKFVTNRLLTNYNIELTRESQTAEFPLAIELFEFPFIQEIFISDNYVSIQKTDDLEWIEINSALRDFIKEYLQEGRRIVSETYKPGQNQNNLSAQDTTVTNDETSQQIISVLEEYIKPAVAGDGGNIQFLSYEPKSKEVNVLLQGACNGCPSSTITLKNGIEATLKQLLPGKINTVNALN